MTLINPDSTMYGMAKIMPKICHAFIIRENQLNPRYPRSILKVMIEGASYFHRFAPQSIQLRN